MVLCTCQFKISYLMAESSWKRRIVGDLAWALDVVPVKRAQDDAKRGSGTVHIGRPAVATTAQESTTDLPELTITGVNTKFTAELHPSDKIRPSGTFFALKVKKIVSDVAIVAEAAGLPDDFPFPADNESVPFDVLKKIPLTIVFQKVLDKLSSGGAIGIFPEGGSHDRTDLLPLKIGISLIAYSALEKDGLNIPIVPVGLSYFRAHRWRGRAAVEYGRPILIDPASLPDFQAGGSKRHAVCNDLLEQIESSMRSVLVSAPDFKTLQFVHTTRRLYQKGPLGPGDRQDLSRRFAEGYKRLLLQTAGNPPKEWLDLKSRILAYQNELKELGLKDYQVPAITGEHLEEALEDALQKVDGDKFLSFLQFIYQFVHLFALLAIAAIPSVLLNLPVGILAGIYAERRRKRALAESKVKIRGFDVMLTEKVMFCIVMVPALWITYGLLLAFGTRMDHSTVALTLICFPVFSYIGIVVAEAGMVDWKDLQPYWMRMQPSSRQRLAALPSTRKHLQEDLRSFIRSVGPGFGDLYYEKDLDWTAVQEASKQSEKPESKKAK
jgi:glycerol-3-phosphate O-acyltransferase / dihydroxyacetone phosphate acyltransferase